MQKHIKNYLRATGKIESDIFLCENCGSNQRVQFHHLEFRSHQGTDEFENIMILCNNCHDKAHYKAKPYLHYEELKEKHMKLVNHLKQG